MEVDCISNTEICGVKSCLAANFVFYIVRVRILIIRKQYSFEKLFAVKCGVMAEGMNKSGCVGYIIRG